MWHQVITDPGARPLEVLRTSAQYQGFFAAVEREAIKAAKAEGATWEQIGEALGITRQAVWQRYRDVIHSAKVDPNNFRRWLKTETQDFHPGPLGSPPRIAHSKRRGHM
jgi:hypothetical protein